jgi:parvulin-like peptidyl-prolyl isomerase
MTGERATRVLLAVGAGLGLALAAAGLVAGRPTASDLPPGAVASVNGTRVSAEEFDQAVAALAADRRTPLTDEDKRHVLDRLLDEELLVQHGLTLDLVRRDQAVHAALVSAVIELLASEASAREPTRAALEAFYAEHRDWFAQPGRVRVQQVFVRVRADEEAAPAEARARDATRRLRAGEPFATVRAALGDTEVAPLPDGWLAPAKLRDYLGPTAAHAVLGLDPKVASDPVRSSAGFHVLEVLDREPARVPPFDEIEPQVRAEAQRRRDEDALRTRLDELRAASNVRIAPRLP